MPPTRLMFCCVAFAWAIADLATQTFGGSPVPAGPLDETAHLLTTLLVLWALGGGSPGFMLAALIASVAIDLDHVPDQLGTQVLTAGTPRPYTHSLLTIVVVLGFALLWPRRRQVLAGVAIGLAIHFWRDLAEPGSGVALLWPWSEQSFSLPHWSYVATMVGVLAAGIWRIRRPLGRWHSPQRRMGTQIQRV